MAHPIDYYIYEFLEKNKYEFIKVMLCQLTQSLKVSIQFLAQIFFYQLFKIHTSNGS